MTSYRLSSGGRIGRDKPLDFTFDGKPMLTINDLPAKVAQVVGDMRTNKPAIRVRPAEDADKDLASVREGLQGAFVSSSGTVSRLEPLQAQALFQRELRFWESRVAVR